MHSLARPPLLANECIEAPVVAGLRELGYDVAQAWDWISIGLRTNEDPDILDLGRELGRVVLTYDKQAKAFDSLLDPGAGLIVSRNTPSDLARVAPYIDSSLQAVGFSSVRDSLIIIRPGYVRIRYSTDPPREILVQNL